jgi:ABC-2 type transport system ATP-binding protein
MLAADNRASVQPLACHGLTKRFGRRVALDNADLQVRAGEVVGYLGPNGAGKTTTLRLLSGALRPTSGRSTLAGLDCWQQARLAHVGLGYLPSDPVFEPRLTGSAVLASAAVMRGVWPRSVQEVQRGLAAQLDLDLDRPVRELSRGNRQKLSVVLAFWHRPAVLLLDEPATGLDPLAQQTLHELIRTARDRGAAVLLSSHLLAEVEAVASRVVVLRQGRVVADQSMAGLAANAPHRLTVTLQDPGDALALEAVPGAQCLRRAGATIEFSVPRRCLDSMVKAIATVPIMDLRVHEAELDEWFRGLYTGDSSSASERALAQAVQ